MFRSELIVQSSCLHLLGRRQCVLVPGLAFVEREWPVDSRGVGRLCRGEWCRNCQTYMAGW